MSARRAARPTHSPGPLPRPHRSRHRRHRPFAPPRRQRTPTAGKAEPNVFQTAFFSPKPRSPPASALSSHPRRRSCRTAPADRASPPPLPRVSLQRPREGERGGLPRLGSVHTRCPGRSRRRRPAPRELGGEAGPAPVRFGPARAAQDGRVGLHRLDFAGGTKPCPEGLFHRCKISSLSYCSHPRNSSAQFPLVSKFKEQKCICGAAAPREPFPHPHSPLSYFCPFPVCHRCTN